MNVTIISVGLKSILIYTLPLRSLGDIFYFYTQYSSRIVEYLNRAIVDLLIHLFEQSFCLTFPDLRVAILLNSRYEVI